MHVFSFNFKQIKYFVLLSENGNYCNSNVIYCNFNDDLKKKKNYFNNEL